MEFELKKVNDSDYNNTTELEQEEVNDSLIMPDVENNTAELDQEQGSNSCCKCDFIFKSEKWKTFLKIKDFALSWWMLVDVIYDIISCCGFFSKWKVSQN